MAKTVSGMDQGDEGKRTIVEVSKYQRWLRAPAQLEDGSLIEREKGTPQGGVISPLRYLPKSIDISSENFCDIRFISLILPKLCYSQ
jgi:retron-type reverse transcriptase